MHRQHSSSTTPQTWRAKLLKFVVWGVTLTIITFFAAHVAWKFSGSGEWKIEFDRGDGVTIYSLKLPGETAKKFKGTVKLRSALSPIVAAMYDPTVCEDMGCYKVKFFDEPTPAWRFSTFRFDFPLFFNTREYVVMTTAHQDPRTLRVQITIAAAADALPPDSCCVRVRHMYNTVRLTPLNSGEVFVEYSVDLNEGGLIPTYLLNIIRPEFIHATLSGMQELVDREKYSDVQFDFIQEVPAA